MSGRWFTGRMMDPQRQLVLNPLLTITILLLAFALRTYQLDTQSIWWDEGHSIEMASASIADIPTLPGMDVHPPGFFAALHLWMDGFGRSVFALRYFSVIFSMLTVALLMQFGRYLAGPWAAGWLGLLVALSPFYVAYAQEVRMYAMVTFWATGSVYFLWRLILSNRPGPLFKSQPHLSPNLLGTIIFTTASLYTHYFTIFLLLFENLIWAGWVLNKIRRDDSQSRFSSGLEALKLWFGAQLAILLLFLPQLRLALRQVTTYTNPNLQPPALLTFLTTNWRAYTVGLTTDLVATQPYLWLLALLLVAALVGQMRQRSALILLAWLLIPLAAYFLVLQRQPSFVPRYMMLVTPSLFVLLALPLAKRGWLWQVGGVAIAAILAVGLWSYFNNVDHFKDDAAGVAAWLSNETTLNDVVYVDVPHPFHYYAPVIPAPTAYFFVDVHTATERLNQEALGRDRLFWVTWWGSDTDPRGIIPYLLQKQAGPPQGEVQFKGYQVRWYSLSDQAFMLPEELPPSDVNFDNVLKLDGLAYSSTLTAGGTAWATLKFSQLSATVINYKMSLRLRSPEGALLAQQDKVILNDRHFQTAAWPIDDPALNQAINVYTLALNDPSYTGPLTLEAVVYDAETLASIAAYGVPTTNDDLVSAQIGQIQVNDQISQ